MSPSPIPRRAALVLLTGALAPLACGDDGGASDSATAAATGATTATADPTAATATDGATTAASESESGSATDGATTASTTAATTTATTTDATSSGTTGDPESTGVSATAGGCDACVEPNQVCVDDQCVTLCQGQDPDPCGPDQVCDVQSGQCKDPGSPCTIAGPTEPCGPRTCGPGTVCDGQGECLPVAPCGAVICTGGGACWGEACSCTRDKECDEASPELLNGPFSALIAGIDFADDCTAWMVTLRDGTDYLRRLTPDGELTEWPGVSNLDMGEVKVLRRLTIPQIKAPLGLAGKTPPPPEPVEGYGEVALSYICCANCGCNLDPPQGVARLVEEDMNNPLAIVITATTTQGIGPFDSILFDAGPQGLAWGEDRVFYVGNTTANGEFNSADLMMGTQSLETTFAGRVTAATSVSPVHLLVALEGGEIHRFNTLTKSAELVIDLEAHVTSLSHDKFTGRVYGGLSTLEVVELHPFTGEVATFAMMPGKGRIAVSPSGRLWYAPVKYIQAGELSAWELPGEV